jgi:organic radical activating enzyme
MSADRDYFCTRKFSEVTVNISKQTISTCCAEIPNSINFDELQQKNMFNLSRMTHEREMMLNNQRVASCDGCWQPEDQGLPSLRLAHGHNKKTSQISTVQQVNSFNLALGTKCGMTCSYCTQDASSAWFKDLQHNGPYALPGHVDLYSIGNKNLVLKKINAALVGSKKNEQILFEQICNAAKSVDTWYITGGETLLYIKSLLKLLNIIPSTAQVVIMTGLGVEKKQFTKFLHALKAYPNVILGISAENTHELYEFNRYGNTYKNFLKCLTAIKNAGINYQFFSTLSNLTVFGYVEFVQWADKKIEAQPVVIPSFMQIQNLDPTSKKYLIEKMQANYVDEFEWLIKTLQADHETSLSDKKNLKVFLQEFSSRRKLNLNIFPKTFLKWLDIHVVQ